MKFNRTIVLSSFRKTRTGDYFTIYEGAFFSLNEFSFNQFVAGNYSDIDYDVLETTLPATNDASGNPRPLLKNTVVKVITESSRAAKLAEIDTARLDYDLKDIKKKSKDLGDI